MKLFMVLIGCKPLGRHTEQHDVFFGIASELKELIPAFEKFWPEAKGNMHIDGYREIKQVNGYDVIIKTRSTDQANQQVKLFFINLGGYKKNEFEEFHYKLMVVSENKTDAIQISKQTAFFKHTHFEGANSHIDDKYGIDVDDIYQIEDILDPISKAKYSIALSPTTALKEDELHIGYFKLNAL